MSICKLVVKISSLLFLSAPVWAVTKVPSTVALEVTTPLTVFYGEAIDGLAQVTASDGSAVAGTVTFYDGTKSFCTLTLANGASCPEGAEKGFGAGTHVFTSVYSGDATHAGGTSNTVTVTVQQDTTTTALGSSANPVAVGGGVVYSATVAGAHGPVSGAVTFLDGTVAMGTTTLSESGTAALSVLMLVAGDHAVSTRYAGDANSLGSTSAVVHELVQGTLAATTTTLSASANPVMAGGSVTFTASVAVAGGKAAPGGTVTFAEGGTVLGSAAVNGGVASWSTSGLGVGSHSVVAHYGGDAMTAGSVSAALSEVVNQQQAGQGPGTGLTIGTGTITVAAGDTAMIPVVVNMGSGSAKAVSLSCSGLPEEASCSYVSGSSGAAAGVGTSTLRIVTSAPRDCGSSTPYGTPVKSAAVAGLLLLLVPGRRRAVKGLLTAVCAVMAMGTMTGCGMGNCTDLGTRPGTYTVTVTGSVGGAVVSQKVKLVVTP